MNSRTTTNILMTIIAGLLAAHLLPERTSTAQEQPAEAAAEAPVEAGEPVAEPVVGVFDRLFVREFIVVQSPETQMGIALHPDTVTMMDAAAGEDRSQLNFTRNGLSFSRSPAAGKRQTVHIGLRDDGIPSMFMCDVNGVFRAGMTVEKEPDSAT